MPLRTKIDIDANPGDFQASVAALNKYRDAIQKSSSQWVKYGTSVKSALKTASEMTAHLQQHSLTLGHISSSHRHFGDSAGKAGSIFARMAHDTRLVSNNLARSAASLFDIFSGVRALGLFGLVGGPIGALVGLGVGFAGALLGLGIGAVSKIERGVAGSRKEALGLGVDYGRMSAFELNFGRFGDAAAMLGAVSGGIYDVTSPAYVGLLASGVGARRGDAAQTAIELMKRLPGIFAGTQEGLIGPKAEALGLTQVMSVREIVAYLRSTPEERQSQIEHYEANSRTLALSPKAQLAWANFDTALASASLNIGTVLADQLVPLSEPLQHLSKSFVDIVDTFAHSETVGDALKGVESGLEWFAGTVGSQEFKANAQKFLEGVNQLAPFMKSMAHLAGAVGRIGLLGVRVAGDKTYNPRLGEVVGKSADILRDYLHSEARPVTQEGKYLLRMRAAHSNFEYGLLHNVYEHEKAKAHLGVYDDPSIRARQKMQRPQTTSYLDQFQGLRDQRQIIVSDQTHNNVVISSA